jgi:hypothetical protein
MQRRPKAGDRPRARAGTACIPDGCPTRNRRADAMMQDFKRLIAEKLG